MDEAEIAQLLGDEAMRDRYAGLLLATAEHDRWRQKRSRRLLWLALSGLPCWLLVGWPSLADRPLRAAVLAVWAVLAGLLAVTHARERWSAHRLGRTRRRARQSFLEGRSAAAARGSSPPA